MPGLPYTLAFELPTAGRARLSFWKRTVGDLCHEFEPPAVGHLTVKYLGYRPAHGGDDEVLALIPELATLARPFVPLTVTTKGLDLFWSDPEQDPVLFMRIADRGRLRRLHVTLLHGLGDRLRPFPRAEDANFLPHVTISKRVNKQQVAQLQERLHRWRRVPRLRLRLQNLVLLTPDARHPVLPPAR